MKNAVFYICLLFPFLLWGQSQFSPGEFNEFREENKNLSSAELLDLNAPKTNYYSSRTYPADLSLIPWFDSIDKHFQLSEDEKALLKQNHFMVSERLSSVNWIGSLAGIYTLDLPLFLSTDLILFTLHQSYDEILRDIEFKVLEPNLEMLLSSMQDEFLAVYARYSDRPTLKKSLEDVDLYLAVARSLLSGKHIAPLRTDSSKYHEVMTRISEEKMVEMPLFTKETLSRKLDFSQFIPRGHYTDVIYTVNGEKNLENYFRGMMWLGRIDFLLTPLPENPWENPWEKADLLRMKQSALILNEVLHSCGKKHLLEQHEQIISFMVGPDDNLNPEELEKVYNNSLSDVDDLLDNDKYNAFEVNLGSSDDYGQKIMSNFFLVDPDSIDPGTLPISFRLLGQKFLIDSYIFSEVVFDRIVFDGKKEFRMLPDPLDVLSVLSNEDALALMENEMNEFNYSYKISELQYLVNHYDADFWTQSLYNSWLSAIMRLNPPASADGLPYFMQTVAWHHEKLNTQLTSWAQLRHDNILYAKQSYTGGTGCSYPFTYVEPYPAFYHQLEVFANNASELLPDLLRNMDSDLADQISAYYVNYADVMGKLKEIAEKELKGMQLNEGELIFLKSMINEYMVSGPGVSGWVDDLLYPGMDKWDFDYTVADVHTQPTDEGGNVVGKVLHVGNGKINLGVFIAPGTVDPEKSICYIGPVGSFHSRVESSFKRLNDDEWQKMFLEEGFSSRPDWAYVYLADESGDSIHPKKVLKGIEYTGIDNIQGRQNSLDYLLTFPNPVRDIVHFRFILAEDSFIQAQLFDISGRKLRILKSERMPAAEHDISFDMSEEVPGIYFLKMRVNDEVYMKKFILQ